MKQKVDAIRKINKIDKLLTKLETEKIKITIKNSKNDHINYQLCTEVNKVLRECYKPVYANKCDNSDEMSTSLKD